MPTIKIGCVTSDKPSAESGVLIDDDGNLILSKDLIVSGNLAVSGNFTLGDSTTDKITTRGDLYVEDDAFFADAVHITGDLTVDGTASAATPTQNGHLTTKLYVDTADAILSGNLAETGSNLQAQIDAIDIVSGEISHWHEAFEIDSSGEITPTTGIFVSDTMWMLNEDGGELNLEPRANLWRYNQGTAAVLVKDSNGDIVIEEADDFPEDISF